MSEAYEELVERAAALDAADELAKLRELFVLDDGVVYLDGNSLGALPRAVPARVADVITREWGELRIRSWFESGWWTAPERIGERVAPLVGAAPGQVVVGDSTSVNVLKAVVGAVRLAHTEGAVAARVVAPPSGVAPSGVAPSGTAPPPRAVGAPVRDEVLVDAETFPTDGYIAASAARLTGCRLRAVPAADLAAEVGPRTAVVLVNHVDYLTGRLRDLPGLTEAVHAAGAYVVWDLCHSAGALPVALDAHDVDFAVGCTYKFLNGGPGSPAYLYVAERHQAAFDSPLPGWNSHTDPFGMRPEYEAADGSARGRVGTPDILSMLALETALDVWEGVSMQAVRAKSLMLMDFFLACVEAYVPDGRVTSLTPAAHDERGSQVSLRCEGPGEAGEVMRELIARGVVGDFRPPDVLRFGFTPLYVSFADVHRAARVLGTVLA
ncbi:kynureninase [Streptomyces apocyni]|uniref:kynureninase n=1 Tax=Streptomyces apocyni TaxID=2654677 RepID=UPI0012EA69E9|nr:aminotransferase class V-fold PLP-dependent enzyme [Streptomyces apocyni]